MYIEFQLNCTYTLKVVAMCSAEKISDAEVNDILHYRDIHTEAGNINKRFDQNLLDYINYVLQEHHMSYPPRDWNEAKGMCGSIIESAAQRADRLT